MPNFERFANVTVGRRGERGFTFKGLRVAFKITKSEESTPNSGSITIFNASAESRNKVRNIGNAVDLEAGYLQDEYGGRLVISADITDIVTGKTGNEIMLTLNLGDGIEYMKNIKRSYSFQEGTTVKSIIRSITDSEGIVLKSLDSIKDQAYANGFAEMGAFGDIMDKLVGRIGGQWSFQNNELQIKPKLGHNGSPVFTLAKDTGLIGTPTRDSETSTLTEAPQSDGWLVTALLRPELGPGDRVEIFSDVADANGLYHIKEVTHSGDTHHGDWVSTLRVRESANA